jgi:hypothetical protein
VSKTLSFYKNIDRKRAIERAETLGLIADSKEVRMKLLEKVRAGEITLEHAKIKLETIKHNAKKNGLYTAYEIWKIS